MTPDKTSNPMKVLDDPGSTVAQITGALATLDNKGAGGYEQRWGLVSNVTLNLLETFLCKAGYQAGVRILFEAGTYDDPLNDIAGHEAAGVDHLLLVFFLDNIQPSFETQIPNLDKDQLGAIKAGFFDHLKLVLTKVSTFKSVLITDFHRYSTSAPLGGQDLVDFVVADFNAELADLCTAHANIQILGTQTIVEDLGRSQTFDNRFYFKAKAPYKAAAQARLAEQAALATRNFGTTYPKALVLDCDGTLWGGIVGEDGHAGLALDPWDHPGNIFWRVQQTIAAMAAQGVLICLCSKNEERDVDEVFEKNPDMIIRPDMIVAHRINWQDKAANIAAMAKELNIALDALIFVDDSKVECAEVSTRLPAVQTFCVPKKLSDYPQMMATIAGLFSVSVGQGAGGSKAAHYKIRAEAENERESFATHEDFLGSLAMKVEITADAAGDIERIAQLSQKTNQFNLTTRRYTVADIEAAMADSKALVYSVRLSDKFGHHGLTGVAVVRMSGTAEVESLFLSCRILGRDVEYALWNRIICDLQKKGIERVTGIYSETLKNAQVRDFYEKVGLIRLAGNGDAERTYNNKLDALELTDRPWLENIDGE